MRDCHPVLPFTPFSAWIPSRSSVTDNVSSEPITRCCRGKSRGLSWTGRLGQWPRSIIGRCLLTALLATSTLPLAAAVTGGANETRRVVILNSTDPYLPAFLAIDDAQRKAIQANSKEPVEFFAETLDMHRFPRKLLDRDVVALLHKKYRDLKVDVVVTTARIALDFALLHRAEIWPGAVTVFQSVPVNLMQNRNLDPRTIGVPIRLELEQTLDLALRLRPATRRIAVVAGADDTCCGSTKRARQAIERFSDRADIQRIIGLTLAETLAAVRALPDDAVVLYLTMFRDGAGEPHVPREVLKQIAEASPVPVFGLFETYLGHGIAAGSIARYAAQGRRTGELAARVLNGENPATLGVQAPVESQCIADWRQLRRWKIDPGRLPPGCELRFKPVGVWERHHWQILGVLAVVLVQSALIIMLTFSKRRLRRVQIRLIDENAQRTRAEALATRLRSRLTRFARERSLGTMATSISHEINQPLIAIQNYAQAARRRVQTGRDDTPKLIELLAKIEQQAERAGAITERVRSVVNRNAPELRPALLCPLFEEVLGILEQESQNRRCRISCDAPDALPHVLADALQVQLVLVNLLHNAMHAVCSGTDYDRNIAVAARAIGDQEVLVSVSDRGPGIDPARAEDIFEPWYSESGSAQDGGMGVGLAIARAIVDAHGGRIWFEPNPAGGSIFWFTLRTAPP